MINPVGLLTVGVGVLYGGYALPFLFRRVRPNHWYGVGLRKTGGDIRVWYEANAAAARDMLLFAAACVIVGSATVLLPRVPLVSFGVSTLFLLGQFVVAGRINRHVAYFSSVFAPDTEADEVRSALRKSS